MRGISYETYFSENRAVYKIIAKNITDRERERGGGAATKQGRNCVRMYCGVT
jgi:hypothetical protein